MNDPAQDFIYDIFATNRCPRVLNLKTTRLSGAE